MRIKTFNRFAIFAAMLALGSGALAQVIGLTAHIQGGPDANVPLTPAVVAAVDAAMASPAAPVPAMALPATPSRVASVPINSVNHTDAQVIANIVVKGGGQNIVCQGYKAGITVNNVVSTDSWGSAQFTGQGLYLESIAGDVVVQNSYFGYCGTPRGPPNGPSQTPTPYKHGIYCNDGVKSLTVTGCIFSNCANAGIQSRCLGGTKITNCIFLDCGTAILLIEGGATVDNCVVWGGNYLFDGTGWTACTALRAYWPVNVVNSYFLTRAGQVTPVIPNNNHPGAKFSPQGGVNVGGEWVHSDPAWTAPAGYGKTLTEYLSGSGNTISQDWPGGVFWGPTKGPGFVQIKGPGPGLNYAPILAKVEAGGSVSDAIAAIRAALGTK